MKSTGVIRRIDELGRIVIPKEIRRNKVIRDGENVEIFISDDSIILKKYNRLLSYKELATSLCEIVYNELNQKIVITDREQIIAKGGLNDSLIDKKINKELIDIIENRQTITKEQSEIKLDDEEIRGNFLFIPIISLNDSIGLIIMYNENNFTSEETIGKLLASIFSRKLDI